MSAASVVILESRLDRPRGWTNQELAELYRVADILGRAGLAIDTESGLSDEGDPWFIFLRQDTGEVIAHFARIDGIVVAVSLPTNEVFRGPSFRDLVARLVRRQPLVLPAPAHGRGSLYLHPSVVLTAFIATAFALSGGEDGEITAGRAAESFEAERQDHRADETPATPAARAEALPAAVAPHTRQGGAHDGKGPAGGEVALSAAQTAAVASALAVAAAAAVQADASMREAGAAAPLEHSDAGEEQPGSEGDEAATASSDAITLEGAAHPAAASTAQEREVETRDQEGAETEPVQTVAQAVASAQGDRAVEPTAVTAVEEWAEASGMEHGGAAFDVSAVAEFVAAAVDGSAAAAPDDEGAGSTGQAADMAEDGATLSESDVPDIGAALKQAGSPPEPFVRSVSLDSWAEINFLSADDDDVFVDIGSSRALSLDASSGAPSLDADYDHDPGSGTSTATVRPSLVDGAAPGDRRPGSLGDADHGTETAETEPRAFLVADDEIIRVSGDRTSVTLGEGHDMVVYEGGMLEVVNFELGVDRLYIDAGRFDVKEFTVGWSDDGDLVLHVDEASSITFVGLDLSTEFG